MSDNPILLTDDEVATFIIRGYLIVEPDLPAGFNEAIIGELEQLPENPGDGVLDAVPALAHVYDEPRVRGALTSLLGEDFQMDAHRHCHRNPSGSRSQSWHQDGLGNDRRDTDHIRRLLAMYYPQDVAADMGPTALLPGTHMCSAPRDRMATYGNFRDQVVATVRAGSVLLLHYDIWHAGTANSSGRTRYMLKFLFDRGRDGRSPSWDHDPSKSVAMVRRFETEAASPVPRSELGKLTSLRIKMWNNLAGDADLAVGYWDRWKGHWPRVS